MKFKYRKYLYVSVFSIMILGMLLFSTKNMFNQDKKSGSAGSGTEIAKESEKKEEGGVAVNSGLLMKDAYPEVNRLIEKYFRAKLKVDKQGIAACVDNIAYVGIDKLPIMMDEIERVDGIVCYTLDGPEKDSYVVYVYNEVKFRDVSTISSALDGYYVRKDDKGKLKIILSPLPNEVQKIIEEDSKREDVQALISDVNTKLAKAVKNDRNLANLLKKMREKANSKEEKKEN